MNIDELDKKIIEILKLDSRVPFLKIANQIGVSEAAVRQRVKKLVETGVLKRFTIEVRDEASAIMLISVDPSTPTFKISNELKKINGVEKVYEVTGESDIVVFLSTMNIDELNSCIDKVREVEGVIKTNTLMVLRSWWKMGSILNIRDILKRVKTGDISIDEGEKLLKLLAIQEVEKAIKLDDGRELRRNVPEIIYAEAKQEEYLIQIVSEAIKHRDRVIISKLDEKKADSINAALKNGNIEVYYNKEAKIMVIKNREAKKNGVKRKIGILAAGTSDVPIALEAKITAEEMGCEVITAFDVGIAGIHRLFKPLKNMIEQDVDAIIVIAGMEGALPSLVASLVDIPVIGVPTSVGYGLGEEGLGALITMLQSCALGLTVVNIDGGVPAGVFAGLIANKIAKAFEKNKF